MLSFIGIGGAFSTKMGNCSAYLKEKDYMLLIDCGENIFEKIIERELLKNINKIDIILTHFHSDHIGSLGSLLFYCDKLGVKDVSVIFPNLKKLNELINLIGVNNCTFNKKHPKEVDNFELKEIKQEHNIMESYGYMFVIKGKNIYYSGDTKIIPSEILELFLQNKIDYFYQDVRIGENNYHISLEELLNLIPMDSRRNINCMHFNTIEDMKEIEKNGFSLVKIKKREVKNGNIKSGK